MAGFFKKGVQEMMIARPDAVKDDVIYKHPDETVPFGSQLTVDSDEIAVFFRDGRVHGMIQPGRYPLTSYNIPFLSNLVDQFTGGNLFKAEIYFVLTREFPNLKFGGKIGAVEDPKSGVPVVTMVHGTFSIKVVDAAKLIIGLAGMMAQQGNEGFIQWFREQTLKVIRDRIAELFVKKRWPILDVTSGAYTEEIEADLIEGVNPYLDGYGVKVMRCGNFVISISDDDRANLSKLYTDAAYVRMAGGIDQYQRFAGGKALMGAGEGMAQGGEGGEGGNSVLGGAGLGVGFGLAHMFGQQMQQQQGGGGQPPAGYPQPSQPQPPRQGAGEESAPSLVVCPSCGAKVNPGKFCAECGKPLAASKKFCPQCGTEVKGGAKFCRECGFKF